MKAATIIKSPKTFKRGRTKREQQIDSLIISKMYLQNKSQVEMAQTLSLSQGQISVELKKILAVWQEEKLNNIDQIKAEQLNRINLIEQELWESWEKSKVTGKITASRSKSGAVLQMLDPITGKKIKTDDDKEYWRAGEVEEKPTGGDMQYMNGIMWCVQERSKILGLNAPKKIAATDPTGEKEAGLSAKEELMNLISGITKRAKPLNEAPEDYIDAEEDTDEEKPIEVPALAKILDKQRMKSLPAPVDA